MSERVTLLPHVSDGNLQTRAFRSQSFNTPPTLASHRSRRTLSLPAREKPFIPPAPIKETPENSQLDDEKDPCEQQQACSSMSRESCNDEIRKYIHFNYKLLLKTKRSDF